MKKLRIMSIIIFLLAVLSYGLYQKQETENTDQEGPEIIMDQDKITVPCTAGQEELLKGVTAKDNKDGDVSDTLLVESMGQFIDRGRRNITIAAFDSSNNVTKVTRSVTYEGYQPPRFDLEEPLRFPLNTRDILGTLSARDVIDGDLTGKIKISSEYSLKEDEAGIYPMVFSVSNSGGNVVKLLANIEIYDPSQESRKPQFELSRYIVYTKPGNELNPWDFVQKITLNGVDYERGEDGNLYDTSPGEKKTRTSITPEEVVIENNVDYNTQGIYEIVYHFTDPEDIDEKEGHVRLIVVVTE